ncbi:MAG: lysylphosphatidylglycerol synthase transmembrane domain-containing protein [Thermodesulfovibrionales bacterium]
MELGNKRKFLLILAKLLVSLGLLYIVFKKAGLQNVISHLSEVNPKYFFLASGLYVLTTYVSAIRWGLFLEESVPVKKLFSLYLIGAFFNNLLPGIIGGDAVKVYYLYKDTKKGAASLGSVFMDRYIGLFALLSIGLIAGLFAFRSLSAVRMQWTLPLLFVGFVVVSIVFFGLRMGRRFIIVAKFYDYFHRFARRWRILAAAYGLSLVIQGVSIIGVYLLTLGINHEVPLSSLCVFLPIIWTVLTVPISISGFGVREGAFVLLFGLIGTSPEVSTTISFLWFLSIGTASLLGLVAYFMYKRNLQLPDKAV